jgi:uncharacterized protein (UPF0276 family)
MAIPLQGQRARESSRADASRFAAMPARIPASAGVGFKHTHLDDILADTDPVGFLEVHAENYMGAGGFPHRALERVRQDFPLSLHGVCMSIGGPKPLSEDHLARFKALVDRYEPGLVSEHLAWSTHDEVFMNDLLPLPYTEETLAHVCDHVDHMQSRIGRQILLENPSTYVVFENSTMSETDFIREIAQRTGCGLLLDVNNVFVSATNHGFSPLSYLMDYPLDLVGEIHLAGHAVQEDDEGDTLLIDSHDAPVADKVWELYSIVVKQTGPIPTLVEWDSDLPEWPVLKSEAVAAERILEEAAESFMMGKRHAAAS